MPRLPRVTSAEMVRVLERSGFVRDRQTGSHLTMIHSVSRRRVVVPMHGRVLGVGITHSILKQADLTPDEFRELLS